MTAQAGNGADAQQARQVGRAALAQPAEGAEQQACGEGGPQHKRKRIHAVQARGLGDGRTKPEREAGAEQQRQETEEIHGEHRGGGMQASLGIGPSMHEGRTGT